MYILIEVVGSETHYIGKCEYGAIHITVNGLKNTQSDVEVNYSLPNDLLKKYTVNFKDAGNWDLGINHIKDGEGNIIFEGEYRKDSLFLYDKSGQPVIDFSSRVHIDGVTPYNQDYNIPLKSMVDLANFSNETIRGRYYFIVFAIILIVITAIDVKFPLFFFMLKNHWDVRDPEPSDFYITMQRCSWYAIPSIALILFISAIL